MEEALKGRLKELGLTDEMIDKLGAQGVNTTNDMAHLNATEIVEITGCGLVTAKKIAAEYAPAVAAASGSTEVLGEGEAPTAATMNSFASEVGLDPSMFMLWMAGNASGSGTDFSGFIPVETMVAGYSPKVRNMYLEVMGQMERRMGTPIIVIDENGAVNKDLTIKYITGMQEGFEPSEDGLYYDEEGNPHEIIKVGVDAQSVYDADPLDSSRALQQNQMGIGRVHWAGVALDVRQVVYFAANVTGEISESNLESKASWLREHVKPGASRLSLKGEFPQALSKFNDAARTGSLPTLRVQLSRSPRRGETFPRRRADTPRERGGVGAAGGSFRSDD